MATYGPPSTPSPVDAEEATGDYRAEPPHPEYGRFLGALDALRTPTAYAGGETRKPTELDLKKRKDRRNAGKNASHRKRRERAKAALVIHDLASKLLSPEAQPIARELATAMSKHGRRTAKGLRESLKRDGDALAGLFSSALLGEPPGTE